LGGINPYQFAPNTLGWADPYGLIGSSTTLGKNMLAAMGLPGSHGWSGYQAHHIIPKELAIHPALQKINYDIDSMANGIFLRRTDSGISPMARHLGSHSGYTEAVENALNKINLNQSNLDIMRQVAKIQDVARKGLMNGNPVRALDMHPNGGSLGNRRVHDLWSKIFRKGGC
jgi:hypothetical protein